MLNDEEKKKISTRLKRLEGQIRGVESMVTDGRYCMDILNQTRAVIAGMKKVEDMILTSHMKSCVTQSFTSGDSDDGDQKIEEIIHLLSKYR